MSSWNLEIGSKIHWQKSKGTFSNCSIWPSIILSTFHWNNSKFMIICNMKLFEICRQEVLRPLKRHLASMFLVQFWVTLLPPYGKHMFLPSSSYSTRSWTATTCFVKFCFLLVNSWFLKSKFNHDKLRLYVMGGLMLL